MKFDVFLGWAFPFRVLQGVTKASLDAFCEKHGYRIETQRAIGQVLHEVVLVKA